MSDNIFQYRTPDLSDIVISYGISTSAPGKRVPQAATDIPAAWDSQLPVVETRAPRRNIASLIVGLIR